MNLFWLIKCDIVYKFVTEVTKGVSGIYSRQCRNPRLLSEPTVGQVRAAVPGCFQSLLLDRFVLQSQAAFRAYSWTGSCSSPRLLSEPTVGQVRAAVPGCFQSLLLDRFVQQDECSWKRNRSCVLSRGW